jgi:Domain of unknown function (DUF1995)
MTLQPAFLATPLTATSTFRSSLVTFHRRVSPRCCASVPAPAVPTSFSEAVAGAAAALSTAAAPRATVSALIPGLNPALEDTAPYSDATLCDFALGLAVALSECTDPPRRVALLFKSAGTAAAAKAYYAASSPLLPSLSIASFAARDAARATPSQPPPRVVPVGAVGIFVNPVNSRGDPVDRDDVQPLVEREGAESDFILLNPDFTADSSALGVAEMSRRASFLRTFVCAYYFRSVFSIKRPSLEAVERGAVLRVYPSDFLVYSFDARSGRYRRVAEFPGEDPPLRHQITDAVESGQASRAVQTRAPKHDAGFDDFLTTILAFAALASAFILYARLHV